MNLQRLNDCLYEAVADLQLVEGKTSLNVKTASLPKARRYVQNLLSREGRLINKEYPNFDEHYTKLQKKCRQSKGIPRIEMPVIRSFNVDAFKTSLRRGELDIAKPYARGKLFTPTNLNKKTGKEWLVLGLKDGNLKDDIIKVNVTKTPVKDLIPTQSDIWLDKLIGTKSDIQKFKGKRLAPVIVSKEGYILDGHHRFGKKMLMSPGIKMKTLRLPLGIDLLLKIGRSYGNAMGSKQQR